MSISEGDYEKEKKVFEDQCSNCHDTSSDARKMGPTLNVVVVRKSGQVSRFDYSAAMVNKDVIWMRITLFEYLEYLKKYVKGTKKVFAVLKKEQERFDFIKFIASSHTEAQSEASKQCPSLAKTFVVAVAATVTVARLIFFLGMFKRLTFILLLIQFVDCRRVQLTTGVIEGYTVEYGNQTVDVFKGIPYAEKPLNELRFASPVQKQKWSGIHMATDYARPCISNTSQTTSSQGNVSEDCLYLNVFADRRCRNCEIVFYIHGGNNYYGNAISFNETEIIRKYATDELVFIIPAYRLGIFGFLDLGKEVENTIYNVGLHDLILALNWVQKEAHTFGGDRTRVTIYGNSGGATNVQCLLASPAVAPKLIHRAILVSGLGAITPHGSRKLTELTSHSVKCDRKVNGTAEEQLECLREVPANELSRVARETEAQWIGIVPQTDDRLFSEQNFADQMKKNWKPVPLLITTTELEYVLYTRNRTMSQMCQWFFPSFGYSENATSEECARYYKANDPEAIARDALHSFVVQLALENTRKGQPSYLGLFAQVNHSRHADDLTYLIGLHPITHMTANDQLMDEWYPTMIKNFIKGNSPTDDWKPVDYGGRNYYRMNFEINGDFTEKPHLMLAKVYDQEVVRFWLDDLAEVDYQAKRRSIGNQSTSTIQLLTRSNERKSASIWTSSLSISVMITGLVVLSLTFLRWRSNRNRLLTMDSETSRIMVTYSNRYVD